MSNTVSILLHQNIWFNQLTLEFQQFILKRGKLKYLEKGQVLFYRGDEADGLYALINGAIQLGFNHQSGHEYLMLIAEPVLWFGEISLIDGNPRTHDAVAMKTTTLLFLEKSDLFTLLNQQPHYWQHIACLVTQKIRPLLQELEIQGEASLLQRVARRLLLIISGYQLQSSAQQRRIEMSQEKLALMLSSSRQSINAALQQLEQQNILKREFKHIRILDIEKLTYYAEESSVHQ
ncbi:Crp/Fnr family transcriptional regulator [Acinetobacter qingfengensis]|uniref:Uncharacterized protein n=1 Tax=Acinetobacter qingfengensis TaxID=1262585 RepID=A0A1E7R2T2_9GAMM|nr:Crp/Fnr family transcriptional regulator [Acinetobacter qingfengensis]KAA8733867.1 Crp/Fnr family transcriptional regulator [Acinetobacter qingfengensis]OEY93620.1 hypothetical protein BJI46_04040 [Acinetobacter qingfengensis]